jgi:hypothetical protein
MNINVAIDMNAMSIHGSHIQRTTVAVSSINAISKTR